jgi:serine O-acetyltransferase
MTFDAQKFKQWAGDSQLRALQADFARYRDQGCNPWRLEGFWSLIIYRFQKIVRNRQPRWLWWPARIILGLFWRINATFTHIYIGPDADIGPGLFIPHPGPIWVHPKTKIGAGCTIYHLCSIVEGPVPGGATIGDEVFLACNTSIIGGVKIGDGALVAANSSVISDVPAGATAIGVPAKIVPKMWASADAKKAAAATQ